MCGTSFSNLSLSFTALPIEMFFLTNAEFIDVGRRTQGGALPPWGAPQAHMSRLPGQKCTRHCWYLRHCWYINYLVYQLAHSGAYTNNSEHQRRHCPLSTGHKLWFAASWHLIIQIVPPKLDQKFFWQSTKKKLTKCKRWKRKTQMSRSRLCLIFNFTLRLGGPNISPDRQGRELA